MSQQKALLKVTRNQYSTYINRLDKELINLLSLGQVVRNRIKYHGVRAHLEPTNSFDELYLKVRDTLSKLEELHAMEYRILGTSP